MERASLGGKLWLPQGMFQSMHGSPMPCNPISPVDEDCVRARARSGVTNASLRLGTSIYAPHLQVLAIRDQNRTHLRYWSGFRKGHSGGGGKAQKLLSLATTFRVCVAESLPSCRRRQSVQAPTGRKLAASTTSHLAKMSRLSLLTARP